MTRKSPTSALRLLLPLSIALTTIVLSACESTRHGSKSKEPHSEILPLWRSFLAMPRERAVAVAGDPDHQWVGAAAGGRPSQLEAEEGALSECRERRRLRRLKAPCLLYATGDEIVWPEW